MFRSLIELIQIIQWKFELDNSLYGNTCFGAYILTLYTNAGYPTNLLFVCRIYNNIHANLCQQNSLTHTNSAGHNTFIRKDSIKKAELFNLLGVLVGHCCC